MDIMQVYYDTCLLRNNKPFDKEGEYPEMKQNYLLMDSHSNHILLKCRQQKSTGERPRGK